MNNSQQTSDSNNLDVTRVKTLVFDIGGVILDDSDEILWQHLNLTEEKREDFTNIAFHDPRWMTEVMTGNLRQQDYAAALISEHPEYAKELEFAMAPENFNQLLPLYQPNIDLIKSVHQTGKYTMYWLSNMPNVEYSALKEQGILDLLDGGIYSCEEHCRKPDSKFYQILFDRYHLDPAECVFFDDRQRNLDAGEKFGMHGELVPSLSDLSQVLTKYTEN